MRRPSEILRDLWYTANQNGPQTHEAFFECAEAYWMIRKWEGEAFFHFNTPAWPIPQASEDPGDPSPAAQDDRGDAAQDDRRDAAQDDRGEAAQDDRGEAAQDDMGEAAPEDRGDGDEELLDMPELTGPYSNKKQEILARLREARAKGVKLWQIAQASGGTISEDQILRMAHGVPTQMATWTRLKDALEIWEVQQAAPAEEDMT